MQSPSNDTLDESPSANVTTDTPIMLPTLVSSKGRRRDEPEKSKQENEHTAMNIHIITDDADERIGKPKSTFSSWKTTIVLSVSLCIMVICLLFDLDASRPEASKGAAVLLITALWWFTEVVPLTVTSLLPMLLYPVLGVVNSSELASKFFRATSFLFVAGFFIGLAVERWGLHKRVVCVVVAKMGSRVESLIAGFMLSVWLLSMWIPNTATILCMLPMTEAFLATLPENHERFKSGFLLAIAYSATVGGIATPVGTPTNSMFLDHCAMFWPNENEFSFAKFFLCALPLSMALLILVWVGFCVVHVWRSPCKIPVDQQLFRRMYAELGKVSFEEIVVALDLLILIVLWFTASPVNGFDGWKSSVAKEISSGTIGLAFTLPLFFIPCGASLPACVRKLVGNDRCCSKATDSNPQHILDWNAIRGAFRWEILFVFGGGAMIAHGTVKTQLAAYVAEHLAKLGTNEFGFILCVTFVICFVTEVVSNSATLSIFGSIIATTAYAKGYDQMQLLLGVAFASSFAFMLPMAGGPNMVAYSTGKISIQFMVRNGLLLNLVAIVIGSIYICFVMPSLLGSYSYLPAPQGSA